ncbi:hypothetical protein LQZ21_12290 [Treponema sp. TIM-1]|uniref:hypothetical protein n=1 Tax=Treponema sp. TIM-1 TaxID=2898417 RepID=UPI00397FD1E7
MTLSRRNYFFKTGIFISVISLIVIIVGSFVILPVYPDLTTAAVQRSAGILQVFMVPLLNPVPYAPFIAMIGAILYSLISLILIYYFFEKTPAPEILFFAFFVLSFAFEGLRIMAPLKEVYELPSVYLVMASRVLLFGRYFGVFALFAASVYAAGWDVQKQGYVVFIIAVVALMIALNVPIDGLSWDSSLMPIVGYRGLLRLAEITLVLITMISFFVSAYSRGNREYVFIGIGSFLVFLGRNILLNADTWVTPLPGLVSLGAGTWFICTQLHRVYLWL